MINRQYLSGKQGRKYLLVSLLLLLCLQPLWQQQTDSLKQALKRPGITADEKIQTLYLLSRDLTYVDIMRSLDYANQALSLATENNDLQGMAYSYRILGSIYAINNNYYASMQYIRKAEDIFLHEKDSIGLANCYISLGHIHRQLRNRDKEVAYHKKSYDWFRKFGDPERLGVSAHNLGESHYNTGQNAKALARTREAIRINDSIGNGPVLSSCYKVMGLIHMSEGDEEVAATWFKKVLELSELLGEKAQKLAFTESLLQLAAIHRGKNEPAEEKAYLLRAIAISQSYKLESYLSNALYQMAQWHARNNDLERTQHYLTRQKELWERLQTNQTADHARLTEGMLNIDRLTRQASELEEQAAERELMLTIRNRTLILSGIFLIILCFILYRLWLMYRKSREQNRIIQAQKEELAELNRTKDKFFSIVAHDLRSPLGSLKSFTTVLSDHIDLLSKEEIHQMGGQLDQAVDNTLQLADNLILWARSQMKDIETEVREFDLRPLVENVRTVFSAVAGQKGVVLEVDYPEDTRIFGDRNQIEFVIRNLVNNAIKYTREGGSVRVEVTPMQKEKIQIRISDNGVGMDREQVRQLFRNRAERSRRGTAGEKGSGLGLVLSHEFIRRNMGNITVESKPDQGTSFTMVFNRTKPAA